MIADLWLQLRGARLYNCGTLDPTLHPTLDYTRGPTTIQP